MLSAIVRTVLNTGDIGLYVADDVSDTLTGWFGQFLDPYLQGQGHTTSKVHFPKLFAVGGKVSERWRVFAAFSQVSESPGTFQRSKALKVAGQCQQVYLLPGFVKALKNTVVWTIWSVRPAASMIPPMTACSTYKSIKRLML